MDPNAALQAIRQVLAEAADPQTSEADILDDLAYHVRNLDEWLTKGGFLPAGWNTITDYLPPAYSQEQLELAREESFARGYRLALDHVRAGVVTPEGEYDPAPVHAYQPTPEEQQRFSDN